MRKLKNINSSILFLLLALIATLFLGVTSAYAQNWPKRPIHFIVSFAPGAGPDVFARIVSDKLGAELGQPIVVDNRPGASGILALENTKNAKPDGYTFMIATNRLVENPSLFEDVSYDPVTDFEPVTYLSYGSHFLVVNKDLGVTTQKELISLLKDNPGKYNFSSGGVGSFGHMAGELFKIKTGVEAVHIPFKGPAEAIKSVISGESQFAFLTSVQSVPNIKSGKLIALSVNRDKRSDLFPNIPTIEEAGISGFHLLSWQAVIAPKGTPKPIVNKLNQALVKVAKDPEISSSLNQLGLSLVVSSPSKLASMIKEEQQKWKEIIDQSGVKLR